jgi:hypothetical protein
VKLTNLTGFKNLSGFFLPIGFFQKACYNNVLLNINAKLCDKQFILKQVFQAWAGRGLQPRPQCFIEMAATANVREQVANLFPHKISMESKALALGTGAGNNLKLKLWTPKIT